MKHNYSGEKDEKRSFFIFRRNTHKMIVFVLLCVILAGQEALSFKLDGKSK